MTSRERFEAWAIANNHAFKTDDGELFFVEGVAAGAATWEAWQEAERQALERAAQLIESKRREFGADVYEGEYVADACAQMILAMKDQK